MDDEEYFICDVDDKDSYWADEDGGDPGFFTDDFDDATKFGTLEEAVAARSNIPRKYEVTFWKKGIVQVFPPVKPNAAEESDE